MAINLNEQAKRILEIAERYGAEQNFFFITTFNRYLMQMNILTELEETIKNDGMLVTKEYVKGRENVYTHPAIANYNKTTDSANKTVSTLIRIIKTLRASDSDEWEGDDPLLRVLRGEEIDED